MQANDPYYIFWRRHWIHALFVAGALVALLGAWLYYTKVATNPERVFWGMIRQSLATSSVTVQSEQKQGKDGIKQTLALSLGAKNTARARVEINQAGTHIITDVIGTPEADYTRYLAVKTAASSSTRKFDESKVVGIWAKGGPQLFNQTALGIGMSLGTIPVPIGVLTAAERGELVTQIRDRALYRIDFNTVAKSRKNGRLLYTYNVTAAPFIYVQIMKQFAHDIGVASLDKIDPSGYRELSDIKLKLTVDARAHHLVGVMYDQNKFTQTYSAYDVPFDAGLPAKTISLQELGGRLNAALQ